MYYYAAWYWVQTIFGGWIMLLGSGTVIELTGASRRQLGYWVDTGLLKPSGKGGVHRRFTFPDVVAAKTIVALREQGCSLQKVRKAVLYLRNHYPTDESADVLARLTLLSDGKKVYMFSNADQIMEVVSRQTVVWLVNVGKLILETERDANSLPLEWTERVKVAQRAYRLRVTRDLEEGGYVVQCIELPGAIEQGETAEEAVANGRAAIQSVLVFQSKRSGAGTARRGKRRA